MKSNLAFTLSLISLNLHLHAAPHKVQWTRLYHGFSNEFAGTATASITDAEGVTYIGGTTIEEAHEQFTIVGYAPDGSMVFGPVTFGPDDPTKAKNLNMAGFALDNSRNLCAVANLMEGQIKWA